MGRQLRPRNVTNYAALLQLPGDEPDEHNDAGPSRSTMVVDDEGDSGSDFAGDATNASVASASELGDDDLDAEDDGMAVDDAEDDIAFAVSVAKPSAKPKDKGKAKAEPKKQATKSAGTAVQLAPGLSYMNTRQTYAIPGRNENQRQRPTPLHRRDAPTLRVISPPSIFTAPKTVQTNSGTARTKGAERVMKAWGNSVGPGPVWDLLEDRAWFKEAGTGAEEAEMRPRVHADVRVKEGWEVLDYETARAYLPHESADLTKPPAPVPCSFGPYNKQSRIEMGMLETFKVSSVLPGSDAVVFNAGAPVWGLDWCPTHAEDRQHLGFKHYLAAAPFPSLAHSPDIGRKCSVPAPACIQLWSFGAPGEMRCEMVLCVDTGPAFELKWCPLPASDELGHGAGPRKMGILAGTFEDGSVSIFVVPHIADITPPGHDVSRPVYIKLAPSIRIAHEDGAAWSLDWANSALLAIGFTHGAIATYNISGEHYNGAAELLPTHYVNVHQAGIRGLAWLRAGVAGADPTVLASGGYDGVQCLTDLREPCGNVVNRTRDVITTIAYSPYAGGPVTIDHENQVKVYSAAPETLGRGHGLLEPSGPIWHVGVSDWHAHLAAASADGSVSTTNLLRTTRRGGAIPFLVHKVYQMDYSRALGEWRMLERFLPTEMVDKLGAAKKKVPVVGGSSAWPAEVGVQRVAWNSGNGFQGAQLLGSATGSGLCRVDWLRGRWMHGRIPYGSVEAIRGEADVVAGEEIDDDD